jgi:hypothetical protein
VYAAALDNSGNLLKNFDGNNVTSTYNFTISTNTAPTIPTVDSISAVTLLENTYAQFTVNFTAYDADGFGNLKTTATANVTKSGEAVRSNSSCTQVNTFNTNYSNYTCIISMWYFDGFGTWDIGVSVNDTSNSVGINTTQNFTVNTLTAFVSSPSALTFAGISPGAKNTTSNNDPLLLNNTGNYPVTGGNLQINATDLVGETDNSKALYASNFTVASVTSGANIECGVTTNQTNIMSRSLFTGLNNATLPNGNHSVNNGNTGQEQLYVCLRYAGTELSTQSYSTVNQGAWTVRIQ